MMRRAFLAGLVLVVLSATAGLLAQQRQERVFTRRQVDGKRVLVTATRSGFRFLRVGDDATIRGAARVNKPGYLPMPYTMTIMTMLAFQEIVPQDVLFLGTGAGTMPKFLHSQFPGVSVQVVEDTEVYLQLAKEYFGLNPGPRLKVEHGDLRKYVEDPDKKYDIVVFNNFVDGDIPYRLATREFFKKIWIMMELGGLCVVHAWEREETPTVDEILVTMQDVFPEVYMMEVPNTNSVILMGSRRKGQTTQEQAVDRARDIMQETPLSFDLAAVVQRQYQYATKMRVDARVLTDEDAPLSVDEE